MKNKLLSLILSICLLIPCAFLVAGCGKKDPPAELTVTTKTFELESVEVDWSSVPANRVEAVKQMDLKSRIDSTFGVQYFYFKNDTDVVHYANRTILGTELNIVGQFTYSKKQNSDGKNYWEILSDTNIGDQFYGYYMQNRNIYMYPEGDKITCKGFADTDFYLKLIFKQSATQLNITEDAGVYYFNSTKNANENWVLGYNSNTPAESVTIPDTVNNIPVTKILYNAFTGNNTLKDITISNNVTIIDKFAFSQCSNLETVNFPNNLQVLGSYAFHDCSNLNNVIIPGTVRELDNVFEGCYKLKNITLQEGLVSLNREFYDCGYLLSDIVLPSTVTTISEDTFQKTHLNSITFPATLEELPDFYYGFNHTSVKIVILNNPTQFETLFNGLAYVNGLQYVYVVDSAQTEDSYEITGTKDLVKQATSDKAGYIKFKVVD